MAVWGGQRLEYSVSADQDYRIGSFGGIIRLIWEDDGVKELFLDEKYTEGGSPRHLAFLNDRTDAELPENLEKILSETSFEDKIYNQAYFELSHRGLIEEKNFSAKEGELGLEAELPPVLENLSEAYQLRDGKPVLSEEKLERKTNYEIIPDGEIDLIDLEVAAIWLSGQENIMPADLSIFTTNFYSSPDKFLGYEEAEELLESLSNEGILQQDEDVYWTGQGTLDRIVSRPEEKALKERFDELVQ